MAKGVFEQVGEHFGDAVAVDGDLRCAVVGLDAQRDAFVGVVGTLSVPETEFGLAELASGACGCRLDTANWVSGTHRAAFGRDSCLQSTFEGESRLTAAADEVS
jgi:hypothetical protein